jgi:hypothetical protein
VIRVALCAAAFLGLADSVRAEDHFSYTFANVAKSADTEGDVTVSFDVSAHDDGSYSATYSHLEWIRESLTDAKTVTFERSRVLTAAESGAFFTSLTDAGLWTLPKGDDFTGDAPDSQIYATISGRELERNYNSPIDGAPRKAFHAAVTAFAKKLGIDQPEDAAKATLTVEGDRTPAREVPFSSLITNPARYDGKRIAVVGFYHSQFGISVLVPEKFVWGSLDFDREFWVGSSSKLAKGSDSRRKNDSWVRIEGVFSARYGAHTGGSPGVIDRVTKFTSLDGPPKPAAMNAASDDDPHGLEKMTLEIRIQPFPMDGRPIQEVVAALNKQIGAQLAERGLPEDWLKIELDPDSNPKARLQQHTEKPEPLRRIIGMLGARVSPGENDPFTESHSTYTYILPNAIRVRVKTSPYPDDKEPITFHDETFGKQAVRVKLVRYYYARRSETFRVEWRCEMKPEEMRISEALALIHRILPDEPDAKSVTSIEIQRVGAGWNWTARTDATQASASDAGSIARIAADPGHPYPVSMGYFSKRNYVASFDAESVLAAPKWNFTGEPPLELDAAIGAARGALREIPNAEASLQLEQISLAPITPLDDSRCAYQITFRAPAASRENYLTIPVLLSGKAMAPKQEPDSKSKE